MTNDVKEDLEKYLQENPQIAKLLQTMQKSQADYIHMLTLTLHKFRGLRVQAA